MSNASEYALWCELALILTVATAGVVGIACLVERWLTSGLARRAVWQTGLIAMAVLAAIELSGGGQIAAQWVRAGWRSLCPVTQNTTGEPPGREEAVPRPAQATTAPRPANPVGTASGLPDIASSERRETPDLSALAQVPSGVAGTARAAVPTPAAETYDFWWYTQPSPWNASVPARAQAPTNAGRQRVPVPKPAVWPAVCWLAGSGVVALHILLGYLTLAAFRRHAEPLADSGLLQRVDHLASRLRMRRPVRVVQSDRLKTPAAFGIVQATIALPARFDQQFPEQQQDAILAHEVAHLAAADPAWHLAANLLTALLWWQPAVWLLRHRLQLASELAADEATLILPAGPEHLATSLVAMGRRLIDRPRLGWIPMTGDGYRSNLGRRVGRLLNLKPNRRMDLRRGPATWIRCMCVVVLVFCMILGSAWLRPQAALAEGESTMTKLKMTWSRSLAAAAVALVLGPLGSDAPADGTLPDGDQLESAAEVQVAVLQDDQETREREKAERDEREGEERRERPGEARERAGDERGRELREAEGRDRERGERASEERERGERERERVREREERAGGERERVLHNLERERGELLELGRNVMRELEELKRSGNEAAAREAADKMERIKREVGQLEARAREAQGRAGRPDPERPGPPPEEVERRMHHLRMAAENLHAAGLHDQAEQLMREADRIAHRAEGPGPKPEPEHREMPRGGDLERAVHELNRQVDEMRGQMEEMRNALKTLLERQER